MSSAMRAARTDCASIIADFIERYRRAKPDVGLALRRSRRRSSRRCVPPASPSMASSTSTTKIAANAFKRARAKPNSRMRCCGCRARVSASSRSSKAKASASRSARRTPISASSSARLADRGLRAVPLPLANAGKVPENADLVVVANPRVALAPAVARELVDYVDRGGNLLVADRTRRKRRSRRAGHTLSIRVLPGTVVDAQRQRVRSWRSELRRARRNIRRTRSRADFC